MLWQAAWVRHSSNDGRGGGGGAGAPACCASTHPRQYNNTVSGRQAVYIRGVALNTGVLVQITPSMPPTKRVCPHMDTR